MKVILKNRQAIDWIEAITLYPPLLNPSIPLEVQESQKAKREEVREKKLEVTVT